MQASIQKDWGMFEKKSMMYELSEQWKDSFKKNNIDIPEPIKGEKNFVEFFDTNPKLVDFIFKQAKLFMQKEE